MTNVSSRVIVISYRRSRWLITLRQMNHGRNDFNVLPLTATSMYPFISVFELFLISFIIAIVFLFDFGQFIFNSQTTFALKFCHLIFDTRGKMFLTNPWLNKNLWNNMSPLTCGIIVKIYVAINNGYAWVKSVIQIKNELLYFSRWWYPGMRILFVLSNLRWGF